jgi:hypothetical protein
LGTVEFESRVNAEMQGSAPLMFDTVLARLQSGSLQSQKFTSAVSLVDIDGTSKQTVHAVELKIRTALKEALRRAV